MNRHGASFRLVALLLLAVGVSHFTGCRFFSGLNDYIAYNTPMEDFVTGWRNRVWGTRAFNIRAAQFGSPEYPDDFKAGFLAGYANIASGGDGCTPSLPPRQYWSWRFQSPEGQAKVNAWFSGFPEGARAAEEDGVGSYAEIQLAGWVDPVMRAHNPGYPGCIDCEPETYLPEELAPVEPLDVRAQPEPLPADPSGAQYPLPTGEPISGYPAHNPGGHQPPPQNGPPRYQPAVRTVGWESLLPPAASHHHSGGNPVERLPQMEPSQPMPVPSAHSAAWPRLSARTPGWP